MISVWVQSKLINKYDPNVYHKSRGSATLLWWLETLLTEKPKRYHTICKRLNVKVGSKTASGIIGIFGLGSEPKQEETNTFMPRKFNGYNKWIPLNNLKDIWTHGRYHINNTEIEFSTF